MLADTLSIAAIVIALASLGWQVVTWQQSGPVIRVTTGTAFFTVGPQISEPYIFVTAANKGRGPVTVNSWGLKLPSGRHIVKIQPVAQSESLPCRLEPGADASWYIEVSAAEDACHAEGAQYDDDLLAYVKLGDGRTVEASRSGIGEP